MFCCFNRENKMKKLRQLVDFIDSNTQNGLTGVVEPWGEGVGSEQPGVELILKLDKRGWQELADISQNKSDHWGECLIILLGMAESIQANDMLVSLVLNGSDEVALTAMEYVREFIGKVDLEVQKLMAEKIKRIIRLRAR